MQYVASIRKATYGGSETCREREVQNGKNSRGGKKLKRFKIDLLNNCKFPRKENTERP